MKKAIYFVLAVLLVCLASYFAGRVKGRKMGREAGYSEGYEAGFEAPHHPDTVWRDTTIYIEHPVPVDVFPDGYELAPAGTLADLRAQVDSLKDASDTVTVYVPVKMETKLYGGFPDKDYEAQITGFNTSLDWIKIRQRTEVVNNYITKTKPYLWTVSLFAEGDFSRFQMSARAGVMYEGQVYGPLRGYVSAGYEYGTLGNGLFGRGGIKVDLFTKNPE